MSLRMTIDQVLFAGTAAGPVLALTAPLSFWGGVSTETGEVTLASHPQRGVSIKDQMLALAEPIGSSSSSYVLLELIAKGLAPAALILGRPDAILVVGCLAARELGLTAPPVVVIAGVKSSLDIAAAFGAAKRARIEGDGVLLD